MTEQEFTASLGADLPPNGISAALHALWLDAKEDWAGAHGIAQDIRGEDGARTHAYLHRKEGNSENAQYWYRRARREPFAGSLEQEWKILLGDLLNR